MKLNDLKKRLDELFRKKDGDAEQLLRPDVDWNRALVFFVICMIFASVAGYAFFRWVFGELSGTDDVAVSSAPTSATIDVAALNAVFVKSEARAEEFEKLRGEYVPFGDPR